MNSHRRRFLKQASLGSASLGLSPLMLALRAQAAEDQIQLAKRFVFVVKSSGIDKFNLVPEQLENHYVDTKDGKKLGNRARRLGPKVNASLADLTLPEKLQPLADWTDRLTIIQSLSGEGFRGDHTCGFGALSCHDSERIAVAPTIDCLLGQHLSKGPYAMYGMAMNGRLLETGWKPEQSYCYPNLSAHAAGKPVAYQASPRKAFLELFGAAVATPKQLETKLALNGNLLDFLTEDAKRIKTQLSSREKERFELYTDSFNSLQDIEAKKARLIDQIQEHAPTMTDRYDALAPSARIESHFEIASAALIAGLTNVITLRPDTLGVKYSDLGLSNSVHAIGHLDTNTASNGWTGHQARQQIEQLHLTQIGQLASKLDAVPEGNGTMLDNTLIVYMSCAGGDHHGGQADWPFILLGGLGNKLNMGRYLEYPKYQETGHRTIANLYLAFMHAAGMATPETFGQFDPSLKHLDLTGPLEELLA